MKNINEVRRSVFQLAHIIKNAFESFGQALKQAWKVVKLKMRLATNSVVSFEYKKKDGSIRSAFGTKKSDLVQTHIKGTKKRKSSADTVKYFDLEKTAWRSFKAVNLI